MGEQQQCQDASSENVVDHEVQFSNESRLKLCYTKQPMDVSQQCTVGKCYRLLPCTAYMCQGGVSCSEIHVLHQFPPMIGLMMLEDG